MEKCWKMLCVVILLFSLCGCEKKQTVAPAVVTRVQIQCVHAGVQIHRSYTDSESISAALDSLRLQRSKGTAQVDPERIIGDVYEIRVGMSNGTEHIYRHRGGQYLSKDSGPWQIVSRESGMRLYKLLWENV